MVFTIADAEMIASFANQGSRDIYDGADTKAARKTLPKELWPIAQRKLTLLDAAHTVEDLKVPPANQFKHLKGDLKGKCSIRINDQWRIVFRFANSTATDVVVVDYH